MGVVGAKKQEKANSEPNEEKPIPYVFVLEPLSNSVTFCSPQTNATYYRGIWHSFHTICRDEGFLGLYKGLGATLLVCFSLSYFSSLWVHFSD